MSERIQSIANNKKISPEEDLIGLARILKYKPVRKVGEKPNKMGLFEVVAPSDTSRELESLIKVKSGANNPLNIDWNNCEFFDRLIYFCLILSLVIKNKTEISFLISMKAVDMSLHNPYKNYGFYYNYKISHPHIE